MIKVYDYSVSTSNPIAILENAFDIGYEKRLNEIWTARFSLPADDQKNTECLAFRYVEIFDDGERVELFRILPSKLAKTADGKIKTYQCEHVLSTLLDDIMFQYNQTTGLTPTVNIDTILGYQSTARWQVGTVDFSGVYDYKWENENLLSALFSLPKAYTGEYQWTWDTASYPWTLNLIEPSVTPTARIMSKKNLIDISEDDDPSYIITRLYPLGYGEGVNQLTIASVNSNVPYIDASTIGTYGIISAPFIDKTEENPATLKAKAEAYLETIKIPRKVYNVNGADIYSMSGDLLDRFREPGIMVAVYDDDISYFTARIVSVSKSDLTGNPGDITVQISNKVLDSADTTTSLQNRQHINDVYAQGATNLDSHDFADNCDTDNPAVIRFFIPEEMVRINKMMLRYDVSAFRGYTKGAAASGSHAHLMFKDIGGGVWEGDPPANWRSFMSAEGSHNHGLTDHAHGNAANTAQGSNYPDHEHSFNYPLYTMQARKSDVDEDWWNVGLAVPTSGGSAVPEDIWTWGTADDHEHETIFGIFISPQTPTMVTVAVDGNVIAGLGLSETDVDIIPYLAKDTNGKVTRGTWHEIAITPDAIGRVVANVVIQMFVQSRGGGDY